jgi:hypothetical protein
MFQQYGANMLLQKGVPGRPVFAADIVPTGVSAQIGAIQERWWHAVHQKSGNFERLADMRSPTDIVQTRATQIVHQSHIHVCLEHQEANGIHTGPATRQVQEGFAIAIARSGQNVAFSLLIGSIRGSGIGQKGPQTFDIIGAHRRDGFHGVARQLFVRYRYLVWKRGGR